jgi:hypothetical protein
MGKSQKGLTTFEIEDKLGIKRNRQKEWLPRYIKPSIEQADGQGTKNRLSRFDLCKMMVFKSLIERGFSRDEAGERLGILKPYVLEAGGKELDDVAFLAFITRREGKFTDPSLVKPGVHTPFNIHYPDIIVAEDYDELIQDLLAYDPLKSESDDVVIINFKKIRDQVDGALG